MSRRIRRILLVCSNYDNFFLEEDGRLEEQLATEYAELNLSSPPAITRAETPEDALKTASGEEKFDLVILMYNIGKMDVEGFAAKMKALNPEAPFVLLTSYSSEMRRRLYSINRTDVDYIF